MTTSATQLYTFDKNDLIPESWRSHFEEGALTFNPTLAWRDGGYAMCYRIAPPGGNFRGLAACQLDRDFKVVPGSVVALSDAITFARGDGLNERALSWHADPRYQRLQGKLYVTWNDGGNKPVNHQFLMEMAEDGVTPAGPARELVLYGMSRRTTEKNWMLFEADGQVYVVYSCAPHITLMADLSDPSEVPCQLANDINWDNAYSTIFGVMRGGAQPVLHTRADGKQVFLSITHSSYKLPIGRRYEMTAYEFTAEPPFEVLRSAERPIPLDLAGYDGFEFTPLNKEVHSVVYPCGLVIEGEEALVSYGINDENLAIARIPLAVFEKALQPVETTSRNFVASPVPYKPAPKGIFGDASSVGVPLFWWDTLGKRFDGDFGERRFKTGNFGDIASRDIFERVSGMKAAAPVPGRRKLVSVGSVLHTARDGDVIWGSGVKGTARAMAPAVKTLDVRAVRGPLTLDFLREAGFDVGKVSEVFDPGCLVKQLFADEIASYDIARNQDMGPFRIVAHYRDDLLMRRMHHDLLSCFLTVDCTPQQMVERMLGAEAVYSSSLHGVIFAESLGIPAYWLKSIGGENDYKFYDYYYGTGRYQVKCFDTLQEAMRSQPMPLPKLQPDAYLATFPHDVLEDLVTESYALRSSMDFAPVKNAAAEVNAYFGYAPDAGRPGNEGFWLMGAQSGCGIRLSFGDADRLLVTLTVRPFNPQELPNPQEIDLTIAGRLHYQLRWPAGCIESRVLKIPLRRDMLDNSYLRIESKAKHAIAPANLLLGNVKDKLTVCIQNVEISSSTGSEVQVAGD